METGRFLKLRNFFEILSVIIEVKVQLTMPLFCKQCNSRRLPKWMKAENMTLWLCEKCGNFVDAKDFIIRDVSE